MKKFLILILLFVLSGCTSISNKNRKYLEKDEIIGKDFDNLHNF